MRLRFWNVYFLFIVVIVVFFVVVFLIMWLRVRLSMEGRRGSLCVILSWSFN